MKSSKYGVSVNLGSQKYSSYLNTSIHGPLNTNNFPFAMEYHNYGILTGLRPNPPFFYSLQEPLYSDMNTNMRSQYKRTTAYSKFQKYQQNITGKLTTSNPYNIYSSQKKAAVSSHSNYISPIASSMRTNNIKSETIGKSVYKVGLPLNAPIASKSYDASKTRSSLRRMRSSGCTAPAKKGSIYNNYLRNSAIYSWSGIPIRNTY